MLKLCWTSQCIHILLQTEIFLFICVADNIYADRICVDRYFVLVNLCVIHEYKKSYTRGTNIQFTTVESNTCKSNFNDHQ
jgi:hypothetical protein